MISYEILSCTIVLLLASIIEFVWVIKLKKGQNKDVAIRKRCLGLGIILFIIGLVTTILILANKEVFHWRYDIITGEAVNHYSTFSRCLITGIIGTVVSGISSLIASKHVF